MRILLLCTSSEDYLQDSVIHGFKELLGSNAIEYPVKPMLYNDFKEKSTIRGGGFTLYGLLDSALKPSEDFNLLKEIENDSFDKIIFTSIYRQYELFYKLYPMLNKRRDKVIVMDGEDTDILFPFLGMHLKKFFLKPKPHKTFQYFKRELTPNTIRSYYYRLINVERAKKKTIHSNIQRTAFAIPKEKIVESIPVKTKDFAEHIVDIEVAEKLSKNKSGYAFTTESDYYADLRKSKFAITTKRAGWDCLRHYEIAANGAVMCFKDLENKPDMCAPHGLIPGYNCISYHNYDDLVKKISEIGDEKYQDILSNSLNWVVENSTIERAKEMLSRTNSKQ